MHHRRAYPRKILGVD
jgi:hypothetical protein